jgi:tRNA G18 (ribose-2'-O)-methylase SpoU
VTPRFPESAFAHIRDAAWLEAHGWFVAEGRHVTRRLLQSQHFETAAILLTQVAFDAMRDVVSGRADVYIQTPAQMDALTGFRLHQGCVSVAAREPRPLWNTVPSPPGLSVCLERVRDPDNVGSIVRSAAALGATRVLIGPDCADPFYRKAIRTSMGAVFTVPIVDASPWPDVIADLRASGHCVVATTPDVSAVPIGEVLAGQRLDRIVLLVGSEGDGLSEGAASAADVRARIPMVPGADSLNVGVATAVALYALSARSTLPT